MKCRCHPNSPFLWRNDKTPTIFVSEKINQYSKLSASQSAYVDRERNNGRDISHIAGLSKASHAQRLTDFKRFAVYSFAKPSK
jgi:hypothetical protein